MAMLTRKRFLSGVTGLTVGGAIRPRPARATGQRTLRLGYLLSTNSQLGAGADAMATEVARRTDGRFQIRQYPDATLGGEVEMLKAVQRGILDLAFITGAPLPNVLPAAGIFSIPFLFSNIDHAHAVFDGPIGDEYRQRFAAKDLIALAWGENGLRHVTNAKRQIVNPEDLRGLKLRLPQSEIMLLAFRALGVNVTPLPFPQLYEALRLGTFDGQENPIATILAAKFNRVQKYLTLTGHVYDPALMLMTADCFNELSDADRANFVEAARLGAAASRRFAGEAQQTGVAALQAGGMQVVADIDREHFVTGMASAMPEYESRFGRAAIERIRQIA
jgi:TRAP-type transport system periplasmic protein